MTGGRETSIAAGTSDRGCARSALEIRNVPRTLAQMSFAELQQSIARDAAPPPALSLPVQALWHDAHGDWTRAHECAQQDHGSNGSWVHAYLHRKEGDIGNAGYWYSRAGRKMPATGVSLETEWADLARELLR
jgi:hypothetical protein